MRLLPSGVGAALAAAMLFGASIPFAKLLLGEISPVLLAGLLYFGSGVGLSLVRLARRSQTAPSTREASLPRAQWPWLAGAVLFGGALGPVLLMLGLNSTPAATASLLLNLEGVLTALLAWFVFRENFDTRIALGMVAIVAGGLLLSWPNLLTNHVTHMRNHIHSLFGDQIPKSLSCAGGLSPSQPMDSGLSSTWSPGCRIQRSD